MKKIARSHSQVQTVRWRYHQIGLLSSNVRRIEYNCSACVKYRIRLMSRSHVKYNCSAFVQYKISFGTFLPGTYSSACVQDGYFHDVFACGTYQKCVFTRKDVFFGTLSCLLKLFSIKLRYSLLSSLGHYYTYRIDSMTFLLHKIKTYPTN